MLLPNVYPIVRLILWGGFLLFFLLMLLRMIFNYTDPNPFGKIGRFGFKIRKITERFVYPAARFLAMYRINTRYAPILSAFIGFVLTFFFSRIIGNTFFIIDGLSEVIISGSLKCVIGF